MIKVVICGASGKMGGFVARAANEDGSFQIVVLRRLERGREIGL